MDKKPKAKAKPKFKVVKKDEKKKFTTAKPKKEEKKKMDKPKFKVVKKDEKKKFTTKKTAGEKLTGLKKADMKKIDPAELFGKLPKELRQKVLDPKKTGVKVGQYKVGDFTADSLLDFLGGKARDFYYDQFGERVDNVFQSMAYYDDYSDYLKPNQEKLYKKGRLKGLDSLTEKQQGRFEELEIKLMEKVDRDIGKYMDKLQKEFIKKNKNVSGTKKQIETKFIEFIDDEYHRR